MDEPVEALIIDSSRRHGASLGASLAGQYLQAHPDVAQAMRRTGARVVVFDAAQRLDPGAFFEAMQRALDTAELSVPAEVRPLFVAYTSVTEVAATGAFELGRQPDVPFVRLTCRLGLFVGYLAIGEGGLAFLDDSGSWQGSEPRSELVLAALR